MKHLILFSALLLVVLACGTRNPTADVEELFPGGEDYLFWNKYLLIRYPPDPELGTAKAVIYQRSGRSWNKLGESREGFVRLPEVQTYIPEIDESGVEAFDLH